MTELTSFLWRAEDEGYRERGERFGEFTVVFFSGEVRIGPQVALISWDHEHLEAFAVLTRSTKVASFQWTARFAHVINVAPSRSTT